VRFIPARGFEPMFESDALVEMELREVQMIDNVGREQYIVLGEKEGEREFPIVIGYAEAMALDLALHGVSSERPMTHDLVLNVVHGLGGELQRIVIDRMEHSVFHGKLIVRTTDGFQRIDTRPSDAIVIATKTRVPIYVAEDVLSAVLRSDDAE
jgi:uncharacterized protein